MQRKTTLYIDIDDTIIAQVLPGSGFDLRPCVITQLTVLGRMYDSCWLTSWPYVDPVASATGVSVATLIRSLYGAGIRRPSATPSGTAIIPLAKPALSSATKRPRIGTGSKTRY